MQTVYTRLERLERRPPKALIAAKMIRGALLAPFAYVAGRFMGGPGGNLHLRCARLAVAAKRSGAAISLGRLYGLVVQPFDSVRYFEFAFVSDRLKGLSVTSMLDVSSPRLLPLLLLSARTDLRAVLCNPDRADLAETRAMASWFGVSDRCDFHEDVVDRLPLEQSNFDLVTSISVIEHIPNDTEALKAIWDRLKPGGRLILTVPCSRREFDEYTDFNEYGLLAEDGAGFIFGQRFYNEQTLRTRIYPVTGEPATMRVFGERRAGTFFADRADKNKNFMYRDYLEYLRIARDWRLYPDIESLPGLGVVGLDFIKPPSAK